MSRRKHRPIYRDDKVHVHAERCATCVFRAEGVQLKAGGLAALVQENLDQEAALVCHEVMDSPTPAVCRGFYDTGRSAVLTLAERMGAIAWQPVPGGREE